MNITHPLPAGTRVRHGGQQYPEAQRHGTAKIIRSVEQHDGTYEYLVRRDKPIFEGGDLESWWSSYRTYPIKEER